MATAWLLVFTVFKRSQSVYDASKKYEILISLSSFRYVHSSSRCQKFQKFPGPLGELTTLPRPRSRLTRGHHDTPHFLDSIDVSTLVGAFCGCPGTRNIKSAPMFVIFYNSTNSPIQWSLTEYATDHSMCMDWRR